MFRKLILISALLGSLVACSPAGMNFVAGDGATAFAIANSPGAGATVSPTAIDPSAAKCFGNLGPAVSALQAGKNVGLFTLMEVARVAILQTKTGGACGALAAPILSQLALIPGAANAIALAAVSVQ